MTITATLGAGPSMAPARRNILLVLLGDLAMATGEKARRLIVAFLVALDSFIHLI